MRKRKKTLGNLISTLVYLGMAIWLIPEANALYLEEDFTKAFLVGLGGILSLIAVFRFQIQDIFQGIKTKK